MGTRFKDDTKDPAVNVTNWVLLVTIIFSVSARLGTKIRLFKRLTTDDLLIIASLVFGIGQSIVVSLAVGSGYGKHFKDVSSADMQQVMKVSIFRLAVMVHLFLFLRSRLMCSSPESFCGVCSVPPKPHVLEIIPSRVYPEPYTIRQRQMARPWSRDHRICLGTCYHLWDCVPMLSAPYLGLPERSLL